MSTDHFQRLGLPRRFWVDLTELEQAYLASSRAVHPDYHLAASGSEQAASLDTAAAVNEAYNTLRDPLTRAEYLLMLEGGPPAGHDRNLPPAFLGEMLEAREQIELTRDNPVEIAKLEGDFTARYEQLLSKIGEAFTEYAHSRDRTPNPEALLQGIRSQLNAAKYLKGLLRDLHAD